MKSTQLANVLIKILGLSLILHALPSFFTGVFTALVGFTTGWASSAARDNTSHVDLTYPLASGLSGIVVLVIAIILIVQSRKIAESLFKHGDE